MCDYFDVKTYEWKPLSNFPSESSKRLNVSLMKRYKESRGIIILIIVLSTLMKANE